MTSTLRDFCFDCADGRTVGRFWHEVLGGTLHDAEGGNACLDPEDGKGFRYWFVNVPEAKAVKNRVHIDINMPHDAELDRLLSIGATKIDEIRGEDGTLWWTVMADVEGNEFCAFPPKSE